MQEQYVRGYLSYHLTQLKDELLSAIAKRIESTGPIADTEVPTVTKELIAPYLTQLKEVEYLPTFGDAEMTELVAKYRVIIEHIIAEVFQQLPIEIDEIAKFCGNLIAKKVAVGSSSGVVIAGFGEKDVFPSLYAYDCESIVGNRMRYISTNEAKIGVIGDGRTGALIIPFAQREMVNRFMEGIDPAYQTEIGSYLVKLLEEGYPGMILEVIGAKLNDNEKAELKAKLAELGKNLGTDFNKQFTGFRQKNYIGPIIDTVASLPKDELAAMAESLVNLTSFKRRVTSAEQDTVGGPIDVAVISKGDGFVWIKRKHYFDKDLNPYFFANYYRKDEVQ